MPMVVSSQRVLGIVGCLVVTLHAEGDMIVKSLSQSLLGRGSYGREQKPVEIYTTVPLSRI